MKIELVQQVVYVRKRAMDDIWLPSVRLHRRRIQRSLHRLAMKCVSLVLVVGMFSFSVSRVGYTFSYFNDSETTSGNTFEATKLDFTIGDDGAIEASVGPSPEGDVLLPIAPPTPGEEGLVYQVTTEQTGGVNAFCNTLQGEATTSPFVWNGPLLSLLISPVGATSTWPLLVSIGTTTGLTNGDICEVDLVYRGWLPNAHVAGSGFTDEERIHLIFTYEALANVFDIVLNEFLPNPDTSANGLNFGTDSSDMPLGEWVELYNKGSLPQDLAGWYIADESGGLGNQQAIISSGNTLPATTTIPGNGWLVVYFNKPVLNNTGDSLYLYTNADVLVDSYSYDNPSDFCENEPTPGSTNASSTPSVPCSGPQVAENKSYARMPDGTGAFVDPIPTPGFSNTATVEEIAATLPDQFIVPEVSEESATTTSSETAQLPEDPPLLATSTEEALTATSTTPMEEIEDVVTAESSVQGGTGVASSATAGGNDTLEEDAPTAEIASPNDSATSTATTTEDASISDETMSEAKPTEPSQTGLAATTEAVPDDTSESAESSAEEDAETPSEPAIVETISEESSSTGGEGNQPAAEAVIEQTILFRDEEENSTATTTETPPEGANESNQPTADTVAEQPAPPPTETTPAEDPSTTSHDPAPKAESS